MSFCPVLPTTNIQRQPSGNKISFHGKPQQFSRFRTLAQSQMFWAWLRESFDSTLSVLIMKTPSISVVSTSWQRKKNLKTFVNITNIFFSNPFLFQTQWCHMSPREIKISCITDVRCKRWRAKATQRIIFVKDNDSNLIYSEITRGKSESTKGHIFQKEFQG